MKEVGYNQEYITRKYPNITEWPLDTRHILLSIGPGKDSPKAVDSLFSPVYHEDWKEVIIGETMSILNTTHSRSQSIPQTIRLRQAAHKSVLVLGRILGLIIAVLLSLPVMLLPFTTAVPAWVSVLLAAVVTWR